MRSVWSGLYLDGESARSDIIAVLGSGWEEEVSDSGLRVPILRGHMAGGWPGASATLFLVAALTLRHFFAQLCPKLPYHRVFP